MDEKRRVLAEMWKTALDLRKHGLLSIADMVAIKALRARPQS